MKGQHFFFGTRSDLLPGLEYIEGAWDLEYHVSEMRPDRDFMFHSSLATLPGLGISVTGDTAKDVDYWAYPRGNRPGVRSIPQRRSGVRYVLDPTSETVFLRPGGWHEASGSLIAGRVARSVDVDVNSCGDALYKDMSQALLRGFHKVRLFWVGPEAHEAFEAGRRLVTIGVRSPREYDLAEA